MPHEIKISPLADIDDLMKYSGKRGKILPKKESQKTEKRLKVLEERILKLEKIMDSHQAQIKLFARTNTQNINNINQLKNNSYGNNRR
jgi:hypothetical protein